MSQSISAFNRTLKMCLRTLNDVFPKNPHVKELRKAYTRLKSNESEGPLQAFIAEASKHAEAIRSRDLDYFLQKETDLELPENIKPSLVSRETPDVQNKVWDFVNTLLMLSQTINAMPPGVLNNIESMAQECAAELEASKGNNVEMMSKMMSMTSRMMPRIFKDMGVDVDPKELEKVAQKLQGGQLGGMLSNLFEDTGDETSEIKRILANASS